MSDLIDRQAAISYAISGRIRTLPTSEDGENWIRTSEVRQSLLTMPSAQPEQDEWCTDCKEYDPEKHCCPRFNRVIRNALKDAQPTIEERKTGRWIKDRLTALNGGSYEVFRCSECQSAFNWRMGYCGHCGAKMEDDDIPMEYFENGGI